MSTYSQFLLEKFVFAIHPFSFSFSSPPPPPPPSHHKSSTVCVHGHYHHHRIVIEVVIVIVVVVIVVIVVVVVGTVDYVDDKLGGKNGAGEHPKDCLRCSCLKNVVL